MRHPQKCPGRYAVSLDADAPCLNRCPASSLTDAVSLKNMEHHIKSIPHPLNSILFQKFVMIFEQFHMLHFAGIIQMFLDPKHDERK
jgi:hypothetical protein